MENKGRPSGEVQDFSWARKGIYGQVTLGSQTLTNWTHYLMPMLNLSASSFEWKKYQGPVAQIPCFYYAEMNVSDSPPLDTFLLTNGWDILDNWGHGLVMINGYIVANFIISL